MFLEANEEHCTDGEEGSGLVVGNTRGGEGRGKKEDGKLFPYAELMAHTQSTRHHWGDAIH